MLYLSSQCTFYIALHAEFPSYEAWGEQPLNDKSTNPLVCEKRKKCCYYSRYTSFIKIWFKQSGTLPNQHLEVISQLHQHLLQFLSPRVGINKQREIQTIPHHRRNKENCTFHGKLMGTVQWKRQAIKKREWTLKFQNVQVSLSNSRKTLAKLWFKPNGIGHFNKKKFSYTQVTINLETWQI